MCGFKANKMQPVLHELCILQAAKSGPERVKIQINSTLIVSQLIEWEKKKTFRSLHPPSLPQSI